jgi:hypothetical protein
MEVHTRDEADCTFAVEYVVGSYPAGMCQFAGPPRTRVEMAVALRIVVYPACLWA